MFREFRVGTVWGGYFFPWECVLLVAILISVCHGRKHSVYSCEETQPFAVEHGSPTSLPAAGLILGIFLCSVIQHDWAAPGGSSCPGMQPGPRWGHVGDIKNDKFGWNFWELLAFPSSSWGNECQEFSALAALYFCLPGAPGCSLGLVLNPVWHSGIQLLGLCVLQLEY